MQVKIKESATFYGHDQEMRKALERLRGQWVDVDTGHVFRDQYNLIDPPARVVDKHIMAVRDDVRPGMVECGYCGKQFSSMAELEKHYQEEEVKDHECENCFYFRESLKSSETIRDKRKNENGETVEETRYIRTYARKCTATASIGFTPDDFCEVKNHRLAPYRTFENAYFVKYPNGYMAYYESLTAREKWEQFGKPYGRDWMGFSVSENESGLECTAGIKGTSYKMQINTDADGRARSISIFNSRRKFDVEKFVFDEICSHPLTFRYRAFYEDEANSQSCLNDLPKSAKEHVFKAISTVFDDLTSQFMPYRSIAPTCCSS